MNPHFLRHVLVICSLLVMPQVQAEQPLVPPSNATYLTADGRIAVIGNDGMATLMTDLNALFARQHPGFRFALTAKGSSVGIPALTAGATAFAPLSRELWLGDAHAFEQVKGYAPLDIRIGYSGHGPRAPHKTPPAVYVNELNPLASLTLAQLQAIATAGSPQGDINTWGQLGLKDVWQGRRIHVYGLRDDGGFASNQRMDRFGGLPWSLKYEALETREAVIAAVAADPYGIGLTGWVNAAKTSGNVRILPLATKAGSPAYTPAYADVAAGKYPLSAYLHLYVDAAPGQSLEPFIKAYLQMALSAEGQALIQAQKDSAEGYVALSPADLAREKARLQGL